MANISITTACNRRCRFCFAPPAGMTLSESRESPAAQGQMTMACFRRALQFLRRSDIDELRLLGGEPTLHPRFKEMTAYGLERGLRLMIFTNGLFPQDLLDYLASIPSEKISLLINLTDLPQSGDENGERQRRLEAIRRLGPRAILGQTIDTPGFDFEALNRVVAACPQIDGVRFGLAHPNPEGTNAYLHPRHYPLVGQGIADFYATIRTTGVRLLLDCGFVPCMFPQEALAGLETHGEEIGRCCGPIPDILPDGQAVACYPMADIGRLEPAPAATAEQLSSDLNTALAPYRGLGIYPHCARCHAWQTQACNGGCLGSARLRLIGRPFMVQVPAGFDPHPMEVGADIENLAKMELSAETAVWAIPYVDQPLDFWNRLHQELGDVIGEVYCPLPDQALSTGRPAQPQYRLNAFLAKSPFPLSLLVNPMVLSEPAHRLAPRLIATIAQLMEKYPIVGLTLTSPILAEDVRKAFPGLKLTASVLMDIASPQQAVGLSGLFDAIVPAGRILRDLAALKALREAFAGSMRLMVNEACLPGCIHRVQHFYEMATQENPASLCEELLTRHPWLRLTGAWILPQHLHFYEGLFDELKLAGRVTLQDPTRYREVLHAYCHGAPLAPHRIGGGPASPLKPMVIEEAFYRQTLTCDKACHRCRVCADYYDRQTAKSSGRRSGAVS